MFRLQKIRATMALLFALVQSRICMSSDAQDTMCRWQDFMGRIHTWTALKSDYHLSKYRCRQNGGWKTTFFSQWKDDDNTWLSQMEPNHCQSIWEDRPFQVPPSCHVLSRWRLRQCLRIRSWRHQPLPHSWNLAGTGGCSLHTYCIREGYVLSCCFSVSLVFVIFCLSCSLFFLLRFSASMLLCFSASLLIPVFLPPKPKQPEERTI